MRLPRLPRPSLPWSLLLLASLGAGGYALRELLVVEATQWGILIDAEAGTVPPGGGIRLEAPRHDQVRCDSLRVRQLHPAERDSIARRMHEARQLSFGPALRLDEAFHGRSGLTGSGQWSSLMLPALTVRSKLGLPLGIEQGFPFNALNVNSREGHSDS